VKTEPATPQPPSTDVSMDQSPPGPAPVPAQAVAAAYAHAAATNSYGTRRCWPWPATSILTAHPAFSPPISPPYNFGAPLPRMASPPFARPPPLMSLNPQPPPPPTLRDNCWVRA